MVQTISEIEDNEDGVRPVIVQFQNSKLHEGEEGKLLAGIYRKSKKTAVVAVASKNILYTGEINKEESKDDLCNRFLLASNRKTGKVRLIAVDAAIVTPQFTSKAKSNNVTDNSVLNPDRSISQLNKEFGSKKTKRITEQKERLQMNIEDVKEQLEQTVAGIQVIENNSFAESAENDSAYRPSINRTASIREQVYVLHEIVPEHVLDTLEEEATSILSSNLDELELSSFIKEKLGQLQNSSDNNVVEKAKLLLYIEYLIKYITKQAKNLKQREVLCPSSNEVNHHILDNFSVSTSGGRTRPISMRDKTICYILVLTMIAFNYEIDIEALSKSVKLGVKKLQELSRILAFSPRGKNKNVMILKIPLPPAVSVFSKKRKR